MLSQVLTQFGRFIASIVSFVVYIVSRFVKVIVLIIIGAIALSIGALVVSGHFGLPYLSLIAPDPAISGYIGYYAGIIALGVIPLVLLVKLALNFAGGYKTSIRFKRILGSVWVVSFIIFTMTGFFTARNFIHEERVTEIVSESEISTDELLEIEVNKLSRDYNPMIQFSRSAFLSNGKLYNRDGVNVRLIPSTDGKLKITKTESSRGMNRLSALRNRYYPQHNLTFQDNQINLDEYYIIDRRDKFRAQHLKYNIEIPVGTKLFVKKTSPIFSNREIRYGASSNQWIMTEDGIQEIQES